jgi:hypothetical protein
MKIFVTYWRTSVVAITALGLGGGQSFALGRDLKWYSSALECRRPFKSKFMSPTHTFAIFYRTKTLQ